MSPPTRDDLVRANAEASPTQRDPRARQGKIDRAARVAVMAAGLVTFLMCCAGAIAMTPLGTMDEAAHIAYA